MQSFAAKVYTNYENKADIEIRFGQHAVLLNRKHFSRKFLTLYGLKKIKLRIDFARKSIMECVYSK